MKAKAGPVEANKGGTQGIDILAKRAETPTNDQVRLLPGKCMSLSQPAFTADCSRSLVGQHPRP